MFAADIFFHKIKPMSKSTGYITLYEINTSRIINLGENNTFVFDNKIRNKI